MPFEFLDLISPRITLFFKGHHTHTSVFSIILSIIAYFSVIGLSVYFIYEYLLATNPSSFYYNRHINDTGKTDIHSSLFHFVSFDGLEPFDNKSINIIGLANVYSVDYAKKPNPENYDHWIYELCEDENYSEIEKNYLLQVHNRDKKSYCLSKLYNSTTKKLITKKDKNFKYPYLNHGASHPLHEFYGIFIQKCVNNSLNENQCYDNEVIDRIVYTQKTYSLFFEDKSVNVENYKNPLITFLEEISGVLSTTTYSTNNLNFYPLSIQTNTGIMFDRVKSKQSFRFSTNEKLTYKTDAGGLLGGFFFWMQNREEAYDRSYKKIQDLVASLGGTAKIILIFANIINYCYHDFIVVNDFFLLSVTSKKKMKNEMKTTKNIRLTGTQLFCERSIDDRRGGLLSSNKISVGQKANNIKKIYIPIHYYPTLTKYKKKGISLFDIFWFKFNSKSSLVVKTLVKLRTKIISEENLCKIYWVYKKVKQNYNDKTVLIGNVLPSGSDTLHKLK